MLVGTMVLRCLLFPVCLDPSPARVQPPPPSGRTVFSCHSGGGDVEVTANFFLWLDCGPLPSCWWGGGEDTDINQPRTSGPQRRPPGLTWGGGLIQTPTSPPPCLGMSPPLGTGSVVTKGAAPTDAPAEEAHKEGKPVCLAEEGVRLRNGHFLCG